MPGRRKLCPVRDLLHHAMMDINNLSAGEIEPDLR
jgi:hypothetical protein